MSYLSSISIIAIAYLLSARSDDGKILDCRWTSTVTPSVVFFDELKAQQDPRHTKEILL